MAHRLACYAQFKLANPTTWRDLVIRHFELGALLDADQTVGDRKWAFGKYVERLEYMIYHNEKTYGFQTALVACGNLTNADRGLGLFLETKLASGTFATRFRADKDEAQGHLFAQVAHNASMEIVDAKWGDTGEIDSETK
ncbi:hypothetical protein PLICRDRAFT_180604 [Plicaturopsis crispa FD-325 SS-3]|uniref:Uncharacterized protein n=1 Tax=Plicaturopsis crispa FD-325 SS-3 TaxID=944288 RepID=A0A0C9SQ12_PLICR|nr:hypothetical protein PLICRDRAFT_180604 [Plicaturopsis crispa FD-325 SS-3]